jgi:hypothetical protein
VNSLLRALAASLLIAGSFGSYAQEFRLSSQPTFSRFPQGSWDGKLDFPGIYCLTFPRAFNAMGRTAAAFNGNAIFYTSVSYPDALVASVVASTLPAGRTAEDDVLRQVEREKLVQGAFGAGYDVREISSPFGRTVALQVKDAAIQAQGAPFPLPRARLIPSPDAQQTIAAQRIFAQGTSRFEVAAMQVFRAPLAADAEAAAKAYVAATADEIVQAMYSCMSATAAKN